MFEEAAPAAPSPGPDPVSVDGDVLERVPVGPELAAVLARLDPSSADAHDVVEIVAAWARLEPWVAAGQAAALAEPASRAEVQPAVTDTGTGLGYRSVDPVTNTAMVVAGRCQLTTRQAEYQVGQALQLVQDFPATRAGLGAGVIDLRRARVITDELGGQEPAVRGRVEAAALHSPTGHTFVKPAETIGPVGATTPVGQVAAPSGPSVTRPS